MAKKIDNGTVDFNKEKNRADLKKIFRIIRIPLAIILVAAVLAISFSAAGETRRSNIADSFRAIPSTIGESPGYPYNEDELSLNKITLVGDRPLIVTDSGVTVLSQNADELLNLHLEWGDTKAVPCNGRALIFSNTSSKYYLISRTKVLSEFNEKDGVIATGCLAKNGSVAVSNATDSVQSIVSVYNPRQKLVFRLNCDRDYVSSLSLSPNGKKLLIASVNEENAELCSTVSFYKTDKTEPDFEYKSAGTTILKVFYASSNKLVAIGDNKTVILNSKGHVITEYTYDDDALYNISSDSDGNSLLCYKEFGGSKLKMVYIQSAGKTNGEFELAFSPASINIRGKKIAVALDNNVTVYSPAGNKKETYECNNNIGEVLIMSTGIYTLETGSVCKY